MSRKSYGFTSPDISIKFSIVEPFLYVYAFISPVISLIELYIKGKVQQKNTTELQSSNFATCRVNNISYSSHVFV